MYKGIFFCDVDGTILPHGQAAVSPTFFELVDEVVERGYLMCISSGRIISTLAPLFTAVEDKVIFSACNGCMIIQGGRELIPNHTLEPAHLSEIAAKLLAWDAIPLFSSTVGLHLPKEIRHNAKSEHYALKEITSFYDDMSSFKHPMLQVTALCNNNIEAVIERSRSAWSHAYRVTTTGLEMFDICPTDKGEALDLVRSHYGIDRTRTWAFGDNENDIAMLDAAAEGYLMATAAAHLHKGGYAVCDDLASTIRAIMGRS